MTPIEDRVSKRFWAKVRPATSGGCWLWIGRLSAKGYGVHYISSKVYKMAHRYAYEQKVGPIPDGLTLDHLCRVRNCVNPKHLEPVTNRENILRGNGPAAKNARATHCNLGHALIPKGGNGHSKRYCHECSLANHRKSYKKHREKRVLEMRLGRLKKKQEAMNVN